MARCVIVTPKGGVEVQDLKTWNEFSRIVGGYLEAIAFGPGTGAYLNEDGKALNLPHNRVASLLVNYFLAKLGRQLLPGDAVCGVLIVYRVADPEGDGEIRDVPDRVIAEIREFVA